MNKFRQSVRSTLVVLTMGSVISLGVQAPAMAGMVSTQELGSSARTELRREAMTTLLARDDVRAHLQAYGVDGATLDQRVAAMTDAEILAFQEKLDSMPAGEGVLGTVIAVIVILMLLDLGGVTDVFPRI